ncbi:hypothetical protein NJLHNGOC_09990 [Novacetimonas cocois]|uniref:Uncharacterized protein n=1 Tax=Novacetimonas cocois TaxID=1747507 RepID=A0A365YTZ8_9PROT|nr:hypothetical protein NJLHNGOC_09990 [Novacetimonas cocois]
MKKPSAWAGKSPIVQKAFSFSVSKRQPVRRLPEMKAYPWEYVRQCGAGVVWNKLGSYRFPVGLLREASRRRRLFEKRRHPETFIFYQGIVCGWALSPAHFPMHVPA